MANINQQQTKINLEQTNSNNFIDTEYDVLELSGDFPDDNNITDVLYKLLKSQKKSKFFGVFDEHI